MSFDVAQFRDYVVKPSLTAIGLYSESAVNLLLGTAAQESAFGHYLLQSNLQSYTGGIGIYQMQAPSYYNTWSSRVESSVAMKAKVQLFLGYAGRPPIQRLVMDLGLATVATRLFYANVQQPLPDANDVDGLADYWKKYYNTSKGAGTVDEFIINYKKYVYR